MPEPTSAIVTIRNKLGLHARPAMAFVDIANKYEAAISVCRAGTPGPGVDGKSIMQMMMLAATRGTELQVTADGTDADEALAALRVLVESGFDEE